MVGAYQSSDVGRIERLKIREADSIADSDHAGGRAEVGRESRERIIHLVDSGVAQVEAHQFARPAHFIVPIKPEELQQEIIDRGAISADHVDDRIDQGGDGEVPTLGLFELYGGDEEPVADGCPELVKARDLVLVAAAPGSLDLKVDGPHHEVMPLLVGTAPVENGLRAEDW